jgi:hypothetical protein
MTKSHTACMKKQRSGLNFKINLFKKKINRKEKIKKKLRNSILTTAFTTIYAVIKIIACKSDLIDITLFRFKVFLNLNSNI